MKEKAAAYGQLVGGVAGAWFIVVLSLIFGSPSMGPMEWISVAGAFAGIVLWRLTKNATTAIVSSQIAVLIGAIPTVALAWSNPAGENGLAWAIWLLSCLFALIAIKKWTIADALQPITFTVIEAAMVYLVIIKPLF